MPVGSLDIINVLRLELRPYGVQASTVASLAGISGSKLTSYLNDVQRCPAEQNIRLSNTWRDLKCLIEAVKPMILDYRKVGMLRECLQLMHEGRLRVIVFDPTTPLDTPQDFVSQ